MVETRKAPRSVWSVLLQMMKSSIGRFCHAIYLLWCLGVLLLSCAAVVSSRTSRSVLLVLDGGIFKGTVAIMERVRVGGSLVGCGRVVAAISLVNSVMCEGHHEDAESHQQEKDGGLSHLQGVPLIPDVKIPQVAVEVVRPVVHLPMVVVNVMATMMVVLEVNLVMVVVLEVDLVMVVEGGLRSCMMALLILLLLPILFHLRLRSRFQLELRSRLKLRSRLTLRVRSQRLRLLLFLQLRLALAAGE